MAKQHKMYGTRAYRSWSEMKYRCGNQNRAVYKNVSYDERWSDFRNFFKDMGVRPEGCTLDRIDGTKGYSKENCRWATMKEQQNNKKSIRLFKFGNESHTLVEWAEISGIKRSTLAQRIYGYGWSIDKALTTKIKSLCARRGECSARR